MNNIYWNDGSYKPDAINILAMAFALGYTEIEAYG